MVAGCRLLAPAASSSRIAPGAITFCGSQSWYGQSGEEKFVCVGNQVKAIQVVG